MPSVISRSLSGFFRLLRRLLRPLGQMFHFRRRKVIVGWLIAFAGLIMIGTLGFFIIIQGLPSPELLENRQIAESTKIYDRTGKILLYELFQDQRRTVVPFDQIPERMKQATIAIEDKNFYSHPAIDIGSLVRAVLANLRYGWGTQGGSTITQQLAKNAFLSTEKTITRKLKELVLSFRLENRFTKDEILYLYLNQIPYGSNAYGVEAASQLYFQKSVTDLTLAQIATLASLPQAPTYYSPWGSHVNELLARKNLVLQRMVDQGYITDDERKKAASEVLTFNRANSLIHAPHFVLAVQEYLNNKYGEEFVRRAGLRVITTLDWDLQQAAEKAVEDGAARNERLYKGTNAALVAEDTRTGQILAMVGSRNYFDNERDGNFNVATQGLRQPGSAMKPFVYLGALTKGYTPDTVIFDLPTEFDTTGNPDHSYKPEDYDGMFRGPIRFKDALPQSINIPAVKVLYLVGIDNVLKLMHSFGITTLTERGRYGLSLVLGGGEVKLVDLVSAYSTLAQEGMHHEQSSVLRVEDNQGHVLEQYEDKSGRVIEPEYPRAINDILSDPAARAPLFHSSFDLTVFPGYDVALKTGTTNDYRDAWAMGYTPSLAVGVWAGNNDNTPMERQGGSILAAVPIWNAFLTQALKQEPPEFFTHPDPMTSDKPMLQGQYVVNYEANGVSYPQVHDLLFYVNKANPTGPAPAHPESDSQFKNWEEPVLTWARANIPGFVNGVTYNQPLPFGAAATFSGTPVPGGASFSAGPPASASTIQILTPASGSMIAGSIPISAQVNSLSPIVKLEVFFNNALIDVRTGSIGTSFIYQFNYTPLSFSAQNTLRVVTTNDAGTQSSSEITLTH